MADASYFRSPTRRELRDRRLARKESRQAAVSIIGALQSVKTQGGTYSEPEDLHLTTEIPPEMLPQGAALKKKKVAAESIVGRTATNPGYDADVRSRPHTAPKRPIVSPDLALPLSWDSSTGGRNDTSAVQTKLGWARGNGEVPPTYAPTDEQNPRKQLAAKRAEAAAKKVAPHEKKAKPFEYQPTVTKLQAGQQPRVMELVPPPSQDRRQSAGNGIHGKAFH